MRSTCDHGRSISIGAHCCSVVVAVRGLFVLQWLQWRVASCRFACAADYAYTFVPEVRQSRKPPTVVQSSLRFRLGCLSHLRLLSQCGSHGLLRTWLLSSTLAAKWMAIRAPVRDPSSAKNHASPRPRPRMSANHERPYLGDLTRAHNGKLRGANRRPSQRGAGTNKKTIHQTGYLGVAWVDPLTAVAGGAPCFLGNTRHESC